LKGIKAAKKNPPRLRLGRKEQAEERSCEEERWRELHKAAARRQREGAYSGPRVGGSNDSFFYG
jgi:hypothetical protein